MNYRFELVNMEKLRSHEGINPELLSECIAEIKRDGLVKKPILVEDQHYIILDGHHRYEALKELGCKKIPAYLVNYFDKDITVTTWPGAVVSNITKEEIIQMGLSGKVFPPKTTRHILKAKLKDIIVSLEDLM